MWSPSLEELLWSWPTVCRLMPEGWAQDFAQSIEKRRRWRNWTPSAKQYQIMRRMVWEIYHLPPESFGRGPELIETEEDTRDTA